MEVLRKMKNNTFKEYIQPVVVLVAICLVITFALAYVNSVTSPIIAENAAKAADASRAELLPAAKTFEKYDGDLVVAVPDKVFVTECYVADGVGMVVTVQSASFGGLLTEMIGIDSEGSITGVKVTAHESGYLKQYQGLTELAGAENIKGDSAVSYISGATISSNGVYQGVCVALEQYEAVQGGAN